MFLHSRSTRAAGVLIGTFVLIACQTLERSTVQQQVQPAFPSRDFRADEGQQDRLSQRLLVRDRRQ